MKCQNGKQPQGILYFIRKPFRNLFARHPAGILTTTLRRQGYAASSAAAKATLRVTAQQRPESAPAFCAPRWVARWHETRNCTNMPGGWPSRLLCVCFPWSCCLKPSVRVDCLAASILDPNLQYGHDSRDCPNSLCWRCQRPGHMARDCPYSHRQQGSWDDAGTPVCLRCGSESCPCAGEKDFVRCAGICTMCTGGCKSGPGRS